MHAHSNFLAAGGNRHPSAADWDGSGLLAYGADRNLALWRPDDAGTKGVHAILKGHTDTVNAVKFFTPVSSASVARLLLTGASDNTVRLWTEDASATCGWREALVLDGHESAINTIATLTGTPYFVSASADPHVRVWKVESEGEQIQARCVQKIQLAPQYFPLALDIAAPPKSKAIVLAVAGTSPKIQVYVSSEAANDFIKAATLTGHEGWIRSLAFTHESSEEPDTDLILASASQDRYVRLWRVHKGEELPAISQASKDPLLGSISKTLSNKPHRFSAGTDKYSVTFEALLVGHEDWIYTARWNNRGERLRLLTASADSSLSIWELDPTSEVWVCSVRLGEISAQKGATTATGSSGGFWIGLWSPSLDAVVSLGRTGGWRIWRHNQVDDAWLQDIAVTGHTRDVKQVAWSTDGSYLLSTSSDQTTRLFAEWRRDSVSSWHEISRPQIHGYDLNCIDSLGPTRFVSGADEKLLRVFDEPKGVADTLAATCGAQHQAASDLPEIAQIPVMGLSNKAADESTADPESASEALGENTVSAQTPSEQLKPPFEDQLGRHLLWPEREKLYGHGYEVCAAAASHDGRLIATACRATSIDHAVIRLYETKSWQEVKPPLKAHSLTVTSLAFSPDDEYLLSVGRDRQCCVWVRDETHALSFKLYASDAKAHSRMILDCSWLPNSEKPAFVTAGRDKRVYVTSVANEKLSRVTEAKFEEAVTAIACLQKSTADVFVVAAGLENGSLQLLRPAKDTLSLTADAQRLESSLTPSKAITSLSWRPQPPQAQSNGTSNGDTDSEPSHQLAVASEDSSVRILTILSLEAAAPNGVDHVTASLQATSLSGKY